MFQRTYVLLLVLGTGSMMVKSRKVIRFPLLISCSSGRNPCWIISIYGKPPEQLSKPRVVCAVNDHSILQIHGLIDIYVSAIFTKILSLRVNFHLYCHCSVLTWHDASHTLICHHRWAHSSTSYRSNMVFLDILPSRGWTVHKTLGRHSRPISSICSLLLSMARSSTHGRLGRVPECPWRAQRNVVVRIWMVLWKPKPTMGWRF